MTIRKKAIPGETNLGILVVAPANATTWVVAFSQSLIPGALFGSRVEAVLYAYVLAGSIGLGGNSIRVLGDA